MNLWIVKTHSLRPNGLQSLRSARLYPPYSAPKRSQVRIRLRLMAKMCGSRSCARIQPSLTLHAAFVALLPKPTKLLRGLHNRRTSRNHARFSPESVLELSVKSPLINAQDKRHLRHSVPETATRALRGVTPLLGVKPAKPQSVGKCARS